MEMKKWRIGRKWGGVVDCKKFGEEMGNATGVHPNKIKEGKG